MPGTSKGWGVKEGLVESPLEWPGVHAARALVHGETIEGFWFNRTKEWAARRRGEDYGTYDYATRYQVGFSPLPAFRHLSPEEYSDRIAVLIREIEEQGAQDRAGNPVAGVAKVKSLSPFEAPTKKPPKRSPRPRFHVKDLDERVRLWADFRQHLAQYREASAALRSGDLEAATRFPEGSFPPALAFVGDPPPPRPVVPPTRRITRSGKEVVDRGEIPVVEIPGRWCAGKALGEPMARGQPA